MTAPTPNDMPGAPQPNPNPQLQEPISTAHPPAQPQQPAQPPAQPPTSDEPPEQPAMDSPGPDTVEYWQRRAQEWERKGKVKQEVLDKARKWEEAEAANRTQAENDRIAIQQANDRARLAEENLARERVARTTGVEPEFLGGGTEEEMRATAQRLLEWRGAQPVPEPPKPPTAAVPASTVTSSEKFGHSPNQVPQLTREAFNALPPAERMAAVRAGQCTDLGVGKPTPQRKMGNQIEIGAHGGGK